MLLSILGIIPNALNTINGITNAIANERLAKIKAKTDEEKIAADERIETLTARRDVMVARAGNGWDSIATFLLTIPVIAFDMKILLWDKVASSFAGCSGKYGSLDGCEVFNTDKLTPEMLAFVGAVHAFYFLYIAMKK